MSIISHLKPCSHCPGVRPGASRQFADGGPGRTGTIGAECECVQIFPDPVWGKKWSRYVLVMLRCTPGEVREAVLCVPVRPDMPRFCPGNRRQSPGVTTAGHGSRMAKPRCFTVAYEYQWIFCETYNRNVFCKVQNLI